MIDFMWAITAASIIGTVANIKKYEWCFILWFFTNSAWCIYDYIIGAYAQSFLFFVYVLLAIWGIYEWYGMKGSLTHRAKNAVAKCTNLLKL